jgi:hypothetical protein
MINIGIGIGWAKALYSVANNIIANFKARVLSYPNSIFEAGPCLDTTLEELNAIGLLDNASLIVTPNAYTEGILYDVIPNTTLGDMDVVRATTATRVNSAGLIEEVPRNLITYSNDLTQTSWTKSNTTITLNSIANPLNGLVNAQTFTPNTNNAAHFAFASGTTVAGHPYVMSFFVKANGYTNCRVENVATSQGIWFNLSSGTIISGTGGAITALSNGWYLVSYSFSSVGTSTQPLVSFAPSTSITFAGNGTSGGYVFGGQLTNGSTATEYFPTTTRLNIPRIDYTNGSCPSLLVEPQRTNLDTTSQTFSDWILNNSGGVTTSTVTTSNPYTFSTVQKVIPSATLGQHRPLLSANYSAAGRFWVVVKADGYNFLSLGDGGGLSGSNIIFNLSNGTISGSDIGYTPSITSLGNGWYICSINILFILNTGRWIIIRNNNTTANYSGDGTSGILFAHKQMEVGSYDTSSILTNGTAVTRNADVISKTGISSLIGQTEGVFYFENIVNVKNVNQGIGLFTILTDDSSNRIQAYNINNNVYLDLIVGFNYITTAILGSISSLNLGDTYKLAIQYNATGIKTYLNGVLIQTSNGFVFGGLSKLLYENTTNTFLLNKSTVFFKEYLTDQECINLTTL